MNATIMSYGSAVESVARWIHQHDGRLPQGKDCTKSNGLPHRVTLQYVCSGVTNAVSAALLLLQTPGSGGSALFISLPPTRPMVACLRCDKLIPWTGPGVRQCARCRRIPADDYEGENQWRPATRFALWDESEE